MNGELLKFESSIDLLTKHGASEEFVVGFVQNMIFRHQEPWRHYHVVDHPADVAGFVVAHANLLVAPVPTVITAIGHDAVLMAQAPKYVNEELTAQLLEYMARPHIPDHETSLVGTYTRASASHLHDPNDPDLSLFLDGDLKILGASEDIFEEYDVNVGKEYEDAYDRSSYIMGRHHVLRGIFLRDRIYQTDVAYNLFERQAKLNLGKKLLELAAESREGLDGWNETIEARLEEL
ncbi:hypothetical protein KBD20_03665 [Candidatus Saccharibacteria bacterium]|nr:hypothetical protein [Candidatus Saccharibacteria bacterium]